MTDYSFEQSTSTLIVNGVKMTNAEYKAYLKSKKTKTEKKTKKVKKSEDEIKFLGPYIKRIINSTGIVKSLVNFIDNGKKEFGHNTEYILREHSLLSGRFAVLRCRIRDLEKKLKEVETLSYNRESEVYQYIENLAYRLDDVRLELDKLSKKVFDSRVCEHFKDEQCISATGRRLGLAEIMRRIPKAMNNMQRIYLELAQLSTENGKDVSVYNPYNGRRYK